MNNDTSALYIHIPFCISKCHYCDFFSITNLENKKIPDSYINALCNELSFRLKQNNIKELSTIYIGGGTPSLLTQSQIKKIISSITSNVCLSSDYEFSMESNPDDINENFLKFIKSTEINRLSVGIQSLNQKCLSFSNRRANCEQNIKAMELLQKYFPSFSVDFICGLPEETEQSFLEALDKTISYNPEHISIYSLTIEEETPLGKMVDTGKIEYNFDYADSLWLKARKFLEDKNYFQYEVSNFSKKGHECKHNLVYWNHKSYLGCGAGGTGTLYNLSGEGFRWTNTTNIEEYIDFWENLDLKSSVTSIPANTEEIDINTSEFEFFMMGMRKLSGITDTEYKEIFNKKLPTDFINLSKEWQNKNLLDIKQEPGTTSYALNSEGILFLNTFLEGLLKPFLL